MGKNDYSPKKTVDFRKESTKHSPSKLTEANIHNLEEADKNKGALLHKLKSYKTHSSVSALQDLPLKSPVKPVDNLKTIEPAETAQRPMTTNSMRKTISYKDMPWVEFETMARYTDPYS